MGDAYARKKEQGWRRVAAWIALAALLVRALVPLGYMPTQTQGKLAMVLCTAQGPMTVAFDADVPPSSPERRSPDGICAFAAITQAALCVALLALLLPWPRLRIRHVAAQVSRLHVPRFAGPLPPRGPPLTA